MLCCSKFKQISPTKLEDLIRFHPDKYKEINQRELETLTEGDLVQVSWVGLGWVGWGGLGWVAFAHAWIADVGLGLSDIACRSCSSIRRSFGL